VAERVPAVVEWNPEHLGRLAVQPIEDARTRVRVADVRLVLKRERTGFDAILLDVDNGPKGLTRRENDWLYSFPGLHAASEALRPRGVLAVWSAGPDGGFTDRLRQVGFDVEETGARPHGPNNGIRHTIWLTTRPV
jgi:spermidine synthase